MFENGKPENGQDIYYKRTPILILIFKNSFYLGFKYKNTFKMAWKVEVCYQFEDYY